LWPLDRPAIWQPSKEAIVTQQERSAREYEHTLMINAPEEQVFAFVSQVENLPKYLPTTKHAEPQGTDRVRVQGEANGHQYNDDGYLRVDRASHRMEWGADEHDYAGSMTVDGSGGQSEVRVQLTFRGGEHIPDQDERVQRGLVAALESIKNQVEGRGGKQEVREAAS
jgi:uncharacterized protein YndB with AHSA1/START domain